MNPEHPQRRCVCQQSQPRHQPKNSATKPDTAAGKTHSRSYTLLPSPPHDYSHEFWRTQRKKVKRNRINTAYREKRQCQGNTRITGLSDFTLFLPYFNGESSYGLSKFKGTLSFLATNPAFIANMIMALHYVDLWPNGFQSVLQTSADTWPRYTGTSSSTTEMCSASKTTCHKCLAKHRSSSQYLRLGYGECFVLLNLNRKEEYNYVSRHPVALKLLLLYTCS